MRCFVRASVPGAFQVKGRSWASAINAARSTFGRRATVSSCRAMRSSRPATHSNAAFHRVRAEQAEFVCDIFPPPGTAPPRQRLRALSVLRAAGVDAGVGMAPILPGLSDRPELLSFIESGFGKIPPGEIARIDAKWLVSSLERRRRVVHRRPGAGARHKARRARARENRVPAELPRIATIGRNSEATGPRTIIPVERACWRWPRNPAPSTGTH